MGKIEHSRLMDPIESWVDPQEVKRLAEALMNPVARTNAPSDDATYSKHFVGFAEARDDKKFIASDGRTPSAVPTSSQTTLVGAHGYLSQQLKNFRETLPSPIPYKGFFALHNESQVIYDDGDHQHLHFVARDWIKTLNSSSHQHVQLRIGSSDFLEMISFQTHDGVIALAFIVSRALASDELARITRSLPTFLTGSST